MPEAGAVDVGAVRMFFNMVLSAMAQYVNFLDDQAKLLINIIAYKGTPKT